MRTILAASAILACTLANAVADPVGDYSVKGANPGGNGAYQGSVSVRQTGETYEVIWDIGGTRYTGSALGAAPVKGRSLMGPADPGDDTLAVGYVSGRSFGLAFYVEQDDGTWKGIWTYGGSDKIGNEVWTPK